MLCIGGKLEEVYFCCWNASSCRLLVRDDMVPIHGQIT